jgi:adenosylcobinamide-GDP ribazoletransferase
MNRLRIAISFLTILPLRPRSEPQTGDLGRSAAWFPAVGLLIGGLVSIALLLFSRLFPPLLAAALSAAVWVFLTGGLHLDGLADCCDGLFSAASPQRRLEILRDPRRGAFGLTGLALFLILKVAALASLSESWSGGSQPHPNPGEGWLWWGEPYPAILVVVLAAVFSRWMVLFAARQPTARPGGLAADFALGLTRRSLVFAGLLPMALVLAGGLRGLAAAGVASLLTLAIIRFARSRLGGITGDVFGVIIELSELAVLIIFAANL